MKKRFYVLSVLLTLISMFFFTGDVVSAETITETFELPNAAFDMYYKTSILPSGTSETVSNDSSQSSCSIDLSSIDFSTRQYGTFDLELTVSGTRATYNYGSFAQGAEVLYYSFDNATWHEFASMSLTGVTKSLNIGTIPADCNTLYLKGVGSCTISGGDGYDVSVIRNKYYFTYVTLAYEETRTELKITKQPEDVYYGLNEIHSLSVEASGDGLVYQWYVKSDNLGYDWTKTSEQGFNTNTLVLKNNTSLSDKKQFYCLITDKYGHSISSDIVTLYFKTELKIIKQPSDVYCKVGDTALFDIEVQGDGLTYQWQYTYSGFSSWLVSGYCTGASNLSFTVQSGFVGLMERCVVTDKYGNQTISDIAYLYIVEDDTETETEEDSEIVPDTEVPGTEIEPGTEDNSNPDVPDGEEVVGPTEDMKNFTGLMSLIMGFLKLEFTILGFNFSYWQVIVLSCLAGIVGYFIRSIF